MNDTYEIKKEWKPKSESAYVADLAESHIASGSGTGEYAIPAGISAAFEQFLSDRGMDITEERRSVIWAKFLRYTATRTRVMPESLRVYVCKDNYRRLFDTLYKFESGIRKKMGNGEALHSFQSFIYEICQKVLTEIDPEDGPSCLYAGNYLMEKDDFTGARKYFERLMETNNGFNGLTSLLSSYEKELRDVLRKKGRAESSEQADLNERLSEINDILEGIYNSQIEMYKKRIADADDLMKENMEIKYQYMVLLSKYARFEKNRTNFRRCFQILEQAPLDYPGRYRILTEKGMLFQTPGSIHRYNPFYDTDKAVVAFQRALQLLEEGGESLKARKSVMLPLASTLFACEEYDEVISICNRVLREDMQEQNAQNLRERAVAAIREEIWCA